MAEGILRKKLSDIGRNDIQVSSMGIHANDGQKACIDAVGACSQKKINIAMHLSRQLDFDELNVADFIFVMEAYQKEFIKLFVPNAGANTFLLGAWPGNEKEGSEIPDPNGKNPVEFQRTFELISGHIDRMLPFLLAKSM